MARVDAQHPTRCVLLEKGSPSACALWPGNWYDIPHKASVLKRALAALPHADLLLTGGRAERLTPTQAVAMGGEPLLLRQALIDSYRLDPGRMVLWTGSRVTTHNLRAMLHYSRQLREFDQRPTRLWVVEEGFLVRREAGTFFRLLQTEENSSLASVRFEAVGPSSFARLADLHNGHEDVAFSLVFGELDRLSRYTARGNTTTAIHGNVQRSAAILPPNALEGFPPEIAAGVAELRTRFAETLLAKGKRVLEKMGREAMLKIAAPPLQVATGGSARRRRRLLYHADKSAQWATRPHRRDPARWASSTSPALGFDVT
mmetsp:Transcript_25655/g.58371  ORF Transcript_25655/g.58371 Transcript_25655/m.58371 type:complete len:316 (-) Transcript_25655:334-1281(-)